MKNKFNNNSISTLAREKHKDANPVSTVENLIQILRDMGFSCDEKWAEKNQIGTYSLRVNLSGTDIGSNGKGMNYEFARASGYAELLERIQNVKIVANSTMNNILRDKKSSFYFFPEEQIFNAEDLADLKNNAFMEFFYDSRSPEEREQNTSRAELLSKYQKLDFIITGQKDCFITVPYYSLRENCITHIPMAISNMFYGSNGMCAGNTREEALVQGISEIIERYVQKRVLTENICLPNVPDEFLKKFPDIYEMYEILKNDTRYNILIKDASLGGSCSCCAMVLIEKNTGYYGTKFGAHPSYHVALERLFTEATQGITVSQFAHKVHFDFSNEFVNHYLNIQGTFKTGDGRYPVQLFMDQEDFPFIEPQNVKDKSNADMLLSSLPFLLEDGRDVLIHDCSHLGFPSYHIIVPGISEMNVPDKNFFEAENTRYYMQQLLHTPEQLDQQTVKYLISALDFYQYSIQSNSMKDFSGYQDNWEYPYRVWGVDMLYFNALCCMYCNNLPKAKHLVDQICGIVSAAENIVDAPWPDELFLLQNYLNGRTGGFTHGECVATLKHFYSDELVRQLDDHYKEPSSILLNQYPGPSDPQERSCGYKELLRLHESLNVAQMKSPINQEQSFADLSLVNCT